MKHQFTSSLRDLLAAISICSSTAVFAFGTPLNDSPMATPFSLPFNDGFENDPLGTTPTEFVNQIGAFAVFARTDGPGKCVRPVLPQSDTGHAAGSQPYATIGDPDWSDYDVSADVLIETNGGLAFVMGRIGQGPANPPRGYRLALNQAASEWQLYASSNLLASGPANITLRTRHNLRLEMQGLSLNCYLDNAPVTNLMDSTYASGPAGIGCGWRGAEFDNFALKPEHRGTAFNLAIGATATASSTWQDDPAYAASMANDGNPDSRWNTAYPTEDTEWLELDWPRPVTFNQTTYSQYDDRILGYQIQHWNGSNWVVDVNGGQMGAYAADTFPAVTSSQVRLVLTNMVDSAPSIYEFGVYNVSTNVGPTQGTSTLERRPNQEKWVQARSAPNPGTAMEAQYVVH